MQAESGGRCFPRVPRTLPWAGGRAGCERPAKGSGDAARTVTERAATNGAEMAASSNSSLSGSSVSSGEFQCAVARAGMENLPVAVPPALGERRGTRASHGTLVRVVRILVPQHLGA